MGLWHHRIINAQKSYSTKKSPLLRTLIEKSLPLDTIGELALSSAPYSSHTQHYQNLYAKDNIRLIVDGQVSNLNYTSNTFDDIIALYQTYGSDGLYRLKGAFSLVLYDDEKQLSLLFRSFLTGNPLYFVAKNNLLSVSTNPVYLLHRPDVSDTLDREEMSSLFAFNFSRLKGNVFSELTEVKSGEIVIITPDNLQHINRPLSKVFTPEHYGIESKVIEKYRAMIEQRVHESLLPDRDHGIMLSSGMDSSTVAVFAKQNLDKEKRKLTAYSWTLPNDPSGDESEKIKELCAVLDIPLKLFNGEYFGTFDALDNPFLLPDTPYTNPYWLITAETYRHASDDGISALLNGGYGDMLFRGNRDLLIDIVRDRRFELFFPEVQFIIKKMGYRDAIKSSRSIRGLLRNYIPDLLLRRIRKVAPVNLPLWLSDSSQEYRRSVYEKNIKSIEENEFKSFKTALSADQTSYLGMDRYLSGKYGIKRIDPYVNVDLLNYTLGIPTYMTYRNGQSKYFAREAMRGLLPEYIRLQPRVGLLTQLLHDSYDRNKKTIRERLLDDRRIWKQYVDESWMESKLNSVNSLDPFELLVFWLSLNMQQWHKAIKPGGSLYEGKFNSVK